jgi:hypothetical protein
MASVPFTLSEKTKSRLKKIGLAGFLFFLIKGLVWLALAWWVAS